MPAATHAIMVTPAGQGWSWALIDSDGAASASGQAPDQVAALARAQRVARTFADPSTDRFLDDLQR